MKTLTIGKDPFLKKEIKKVIFKTQKPKLQLFNESDVVVGHPSSNLSIAFVYTWKQDMPPEHIRYLFQKLSNYAYITGYWRTTNGARYAFSNILANPNVNKLFLLVFDQKDNGHLLVDAVRNFWSNGIDKAGFIINSKAQNPKFEQVPIKGLERIRKQCDLVVITNIKKENFESIEKLLKKSLDEPKNGAKLKDFTNLKIEFVSNVVKNNVLYDDGARFLKPFVIDLTKRARKVRFKRKQLAPALGQSIQAKNLDDALALLAAFIHQRGSCISDERNIHMFECRSFTITIMDALEKIPKGYSKKYIEDYVDEFINGPKVKSEMEYNYHDRIFKRWGNQVERVIKMLSKSKKATNTRRMVICLWDAQEDLENPSPPCLDLIWVAIRNNKLEFHVVFRSHHLATITEDGKLMQGEGAFVPNMYAIATLQDHMAKRLNIKRGPLILTDFSAHLYVSKLKAD